MAENHQSPLSPSDPLQGRIQRSGNYQGENAGGQRSAHQEQSGNPMSGVKLSFTVNGSPSSQTASVVFKSTPSNVASQAVTAKSPKGSQFRSNTNGADDTHARPQHPSPNSSHGHQHHHDDHHHHHHHQHCCHGNKGYYTLCNNGHIHHISGKDTSDNVFDHPEWQFLKDYKQDGTVKKEKQPIKPSKNKNSRPNLDKSTEKIASDEHHSYGTSKLRTTIAMLSDLACKEGLVVKDVCPDGNCMFAAVVDQLRVRGDFRYTARTMRQAAVEYLTNNPNQEDGTPLLEFLTDFDGTWSDYLARMGREGEWGDQMVLGAIANVLNRRLVVLSGRSTLRKTCMDPVMKTGGEKQQSGELSADDEQASDRADTGSDIRSESKAVNALPQIEELYLGHVAESHYVSLRQVDWKDNLLQVLRSRGPGSHGDNSTYAESNDDTRSLQTEEPHQVFPMQYLSFLLSFMDRSSMIAHIAMSQKYDKGQSFLPFATLETVGGMWNRIDICFLKQNNNESMLAGVSLTEYAYIVTDSKVRLNRNRSEKKDLMPSSSSCEIGYTRLQPVTPVSWRPVLCSIEDQYYVRQLDTQQYHDAIGFKSDWPECAREWATRTRSSGWPNKETVDEIIQEGVYVIPGSHAHSKYPEVEWVYVFHQAEKTLGKPKNMKLSAKKWFAVAKAVLTQCFQEKALLTGKDFLPALLYTCEDLTMSEISDNPAKFIMHFLALLKQMFQEKFIPHYFVKGRNMIEKLSEKDIFWHAEMVDSLQNHIMQHMFQVLDHHGLDGEHGLSKIYDGLIAAQQVDKEKGLVSNKESFQSLYMIEIQEHIKAEDYLTAVKVAKMSHLEETDSYVMTADDVENIARNVLSGLPILEQWLFSFYVDLSEGTGVMSIVCQGRECISLESIFGEQFIEVLQIDTGNRLTRENLKAPMQVVQHENLLFFAKLVVRILYHLTVFDDAMVAGAHHFLKSNTAEILQTISNDEKDFGRHTGHTKMLKDLSGLFSNVYYVYNSNYRTEDFKDLMFLYDEFSKIYDDYKTYCLLVQLWEYFGNTKKADEADLKARSFESEWQTY